LPYENDGAACAWFQDGTTTSGDIGTPQMKIERLSTNGYRVILKIEDQNGAPLSHPIKNILNVGTEAASAPLPVSIR